MRVVFMGTPDFSVPTLMKIAEAGHEVAAVYTRVPQPSGRGMVEHPSPVNMAARELGIPIVMPRTLRIPAVAKLFAEHRADVAVVVAYGMILPRTILDAPRHGCLNLHASLLPRWRGAAPIERAVMAGDIETGAMVMRMDEGLDTGPVCLSARAAIGADETAGELRKKLAAVGAALMVQALGKLEDGVLTCRPQPETGVSYASKIEKGEARIDWTRSGCETHDRIRGLSPGPGAWFEMSRGAGKERIKVLRSRLASGDGKPGTVIAVEPFVVACGTGAVELVELQRAGKRPAGAAEFLRGARLAPGLQVG